MVSAIAGSNTEDPRHPSCLQPQKGCQPTLVGCHHSSHRLEATQRVLQPLVDQLDPLAAARNAGATTADAGACCHDGDSPQRGSRPPAGTAAGCSTPLVLPCGIPAARAAAVRPPRQRQRRALPGGGGGGLGFRCL
jgi:hypothetical protein